MGLTMLDKNINLTCSGPPDNKIGMKKVEEVMHHPDGRPTPSLIPEGNIARPTQIGVARSGPTLLEKGVEDGEELFPEGILQQVGYEDHEDQHHPEGSS